MLLDVALIVGALLLPSGNASPSDYKSCPIGCNCTHNVATCDALDFPSFSQEFLELRLVRLSQPISIGSEFVTKHNLASVSRLYIESSTITEIDPLAFQQAQMLDSLHFVNCTLPDIKSETFVQATQLNQLNIDHCNFKNVEPLKSESLTQLKISFCQLKEITSTTFDGLEELTDLHLKGNKIEKIDENSFKNLIFLSELNLSYNNISKLPLNIFNDNEELVSVDLSGNPLKKIEPSTFKNLEKLVLSDCQIDHFTGGYFEDLENLDLSNNLLTELPSDVFSNMSSLEYLDLSMNRLTSLPPDIFANSPRLTKIVLDGNDFQRLPKFKNNENIVTEIFSCSDCGLESIEADVFEHMPSLVILSLSTNRILNLEPGVFSSLRNLRVLDISYNSIQTLDLNMFEHSTALKKLNLAGNIIPYLNPKMFEHNRVIETIDLSNNGIEEIWEPNTKNTTIPSLGVLNLANNKLRQISIDDLEVVPNIKVLNLNNNVWQCSSELKGAVKWLNMRAVVHSSLGMNAELSVDQMMTYTDRYWNDLYTTTCDYDSDDESEDEDEDEENEYEKIVYDDIEIMKGIHDNWMIDDPTEYYEEDMSVNRVYRDRYSFLWPLLVFMITALFVLFMGTNIILCVLRKRGQLPRNINLSWKNGHSGFVYKPLTEDISRPRSIIITHIDKPQTPNL